MIPIIGILALVVIVLVLVAVVTVVIMRNRGSVGIDGDGFDDEVCGDKSGSHIAFNRSLDDDIDGDIQDRGKRSKRRTRATGEGEVDKISRLDSYEQLNDVKFEGFSSLQHDRSNASSGRRRSRSDKGTNTLDRRTVAVREYYILSL